MDALANRVIDGLDSTVETSRRIEHPGPYTKVKRIADVVASLLLLLLSSPVLLVLSVAALLTSGRPLLYRQRRIGRGGREFEILKFRSMDTNAEQSLSSVPGLETSYLARGYKLPTDEDPRVTRIGGFLRRFDLDEIPQLWNVLRGDMSLVGPRPVPERELLCYGIDRDYYESVRPGLTGLWQVSGRNEIIYPERAALDVEYVKRLSMLLDMEILLRTPSALLRPTKVPAEG